MRFPSQEHWSGLLFPTPGNLPDPGIEPTSPTLAGRFFTTESPGKPQEKYIQYFKKYIWNLTKTRISIKKKILMSIHFYRNADNETKNKGKQTKKFTEMKMIIMKQENDFPTARRGVCPLRMAE